MRRGCNMKPGLDAPLGFFEPEDTTLQWQLPLPWGAAELEVRSPCQCSDSESEGTPAVASWDLPVTVGCTQAGLLAHPAVHTVTSSTT